MFADPTTADRIKVLLKREKIVTSSSGPLAEKVVITALPMTDKQRSDVDQEEREENQRRGMTIHKKKDLLNITRCVLCER